MDDSKADINSTGTHFLFAIYAYIAALFISSLFRMIIQPPFEIRKKAMVATKSFIETDIFEELRGLQRKMAGRQAFGYFIGICAILGLALYVCLYSIVM